MESLLQFGLMNAVLVTVLAVAAASIGRVFRRPALNHALWLIVLAKLITPPVIHWPVNLPIPVASIKAVPVDAAIGSGDPAASPTLDSAASSVGSLANSDSARSDKRPSTWAALLGADRFLESAAAAVGSVLYRAQEFWRRQSPWLAVTLCALWAAGAVVCFLREAWLAWRFHRRFMLAVPASAEVQDQASRIAREMGLAHCPGVVLVPGTISPMLSGIGRRIRLVFPSDLLKQLAPEARGTLLAHELAHYGRKDHWVRGLELLVRGLYWWHPVVWWARRRIEDAEEQCCDAWVIERHPANPRIYAEALLATIDFLAESRVALPPIATGLGQVTLLRQRLTQIMRGAAPRVLPVPARIGILIAAALLPVHPVISLVSPAAEPVRPVAAATGSRVFLPGPNVEIVVPESAEPEPASEVAGSPVAPAPRTTEAERSAGQPPRLTADTAVAISPEGRFSLIRKANGSVSLHDGELRRTTSLSESRMITVAFSPDGRRFAAGCADGTVEIRDSASTLIVATLKGHADAVQSIAFAPDGSFIVSGSRDGEVIVWHPELRARINSQRLRNAPVTSVAVSRDGRHLAVAAGSWMALDPGHVAIWDPLTLTVRHGFSVHSAVGAVAFHDDGRSLVVGEWNGRITIWNLRTRLPTGIGLVSKETIAAAKFSPDTQALSRIEPEVVLPVPRFLPEPRADLFSEEVGALIPPERSDAAN